MSRVLRRKIDILSSMIGMGALLGGIAGAISSTIVAIFTFVPSIAGIVWAVGFGSLTGFVAGGVLGAVVGCAAGLITILFDSQAEMTFFYKFCMATVCTLLNTFLVFTQTQRFFDLKRPFDRIVIFGLTLLGAISALIISIIFTNFRSKIIHFTEDDRAPSA